MMDLVQRADTVRIVDEGATRLCLISLGRIIHSLILAMCRDGIPIPLEALLLPRGQRGHPLGAIKMHFVYGLLVGFAVGGSAVGYVGYTYGKKIGAAVSALGSAVDTVKKA